MLNHSCRAFFSDTPDYELLESRDLVSATSPIPVALKTVTVHSKMSQSQHWSTGCQVTF